MQGRNLRVLVQKPAMEKQQNAQTGETNILATVAMPSNKCYTLLTKASPVSIAMRNMAQVVRENKSKR